MELPLVSQKVRQGEEYAVLYVDRENQVEYEGYPANGNPAESDPAWAIKRTKYENGRFKTAWAGGNQIKNKALSLRADLNYW